jgi:hypothetical protein
VVQVPGTNQVEVFYRGADGNLKTQWGNAAKWYYETDMGGQLFGPTCTDVTNDSCYGAYATPVAIQLPGTNDLAVFYRGVDNTLRYRLRDNNGNWLPEGILEGEMSSDPSAASVPGTDQIQVFYRGAGAWDGLLMTQWGNLAFSSWVYETQMPTSQPLLGYYCTNGAPGGCLGYGASYSVPKAYAVGNDLWVFYRAAIPTIQQIWAQERTPDGTWQGEYSLGGDSITDIAGTQIPGTNTIQIFYVESSCNGCSGGFLASQWYPN